MPAKAAVKELMLLMTCAHLRSHESTRAVQLGRTQVQTINFKSGADTTVVGSFVIIDLRTLNAVKFLLLRLCV